MPELHHNSRLAQPIRLSRRDCLALLASGMGLGLAGCVNVAAMTAKMLTGEPMTTPAFTVATGIDLIDTESEIVTHVSSPTTILREYTTLTFDLYDMPVGEHELAIDAEIGTFVTPEGWPQPKKPVGVAVNRLDIELLPP